MTKVLWFDDQYKDLEQFKIQAENQGFLLEGYESAEEGIKALEKKYEAFDLILLDGLFYEKKIKGSVDARGIGKVIGKIMELNTKKNIPFFVLSGQDKFTKQDNTLLTAYNIKPYDKKNPADLMKLFQDMKEVVKNLPDHQIKFRHAKLLDVCSDDLLGFDNYLRLFELVKQIEEKTKIDGGEKILNEIRKIIEGLFEVLGKYQIIPNEIIGKKGWVNGSSLFLAGIHKDYDYKEKIVPKIISNNIYRLLEIIQDGSHAYSELKFKVDNHIKNSESDYFFRSNVYLLFDILLWFKEFIIDNQNIEKNKNKWILKEENWITGKVTRIAENNYGTFEDGTSIPPHLVLEHSLKTGDMVNILKNKENKNHIEKITRSN